MIPPHLAKAWDVFNKGRAAVGAPRLRWDDRLAAMAQDLADYAQVVLQVGGNYLDDAHHAFIERATMHGWPWCNEHGFMLPGPSDAGPSGNWSECGAIGGGTTGYPPMSAEEHARDVVATLTALPPTEGHARDFRASWTHGGIGFSADERFFIIEYGYLPEDV